MTSDVVSTTTVPGSGAAPQGELTRQVRGSSLLLVGKVISVLVNLLVQVLIVRYLTKSDYGAFAYALSLVTMASTVVTLGLDRGVSRFLALYDEEHDQRKLLGTIVLQAGVILCLGLSAVVLAIGLQGWLRSSAIDDPVAVSILLILVLLAPIEAYDGLMVNVFAVFARPGAIFFRRHVLTPLLRLSVVGVLILAGRDVEFLAIGYVLTGLIGVALYTGLLVRLLRQRGLLTGVRANGVSMPIRAMFAFCLPLLTTDLLFVLMNTTDVILLGRYGGAEDVAAYRVVQPAARVNQLVFTSFAVLFTPLMARMFARKDEEGASTLYWHTAVWVAVFSFPLFALTFSFAGPLTVTLFGERYASSATYLSLLAGGYYINAALGFNGTTLRMLGLVRYSVTVSLIAAAVNVVLNFALIPRHGALGAAIATALTLVGHNALKQTGLRLGTGITIFDWRYLRIYLVIVASAGLLLGVQVLFDPHLAVGAVLVAATSFLVLLVGRSELDVGDTFPEVLRVPIIGRLLSSGGARP